MDFDFTRESGFFLVRPGSHARGPGRAASLFVPGVAELVDNALRPFGVTADNGFALP